MANLENATCMKVTVDDLEFSCCGPQPKQPRTIPVELLTLNPDELRAIYEVCYAEPDESVDDITLLGSLVGFYATIGAHPIEVHALAVKVRQEAFMSFLHGFGQKLLPPSPVVWIEEVNEYEEWPLLRIER